MNILSSASAAPMRELTNAEVDEVSGGALPLLVVGAAILIAGAMQKSGEDSSSENEESESNESDD